MLCNPVRSFETVLRMFKNSPPPPSLPLMLLGMKIKGEKCFAKTDRKVSFKVHENT